MTWKGHNIFKSVWIISTLALSTTAPVAADAEEHAAKIGSCSIST